MHLFASPTARPCAAITCLVQVLFVVEKLQLQNFLPCFIGKTVAIKSSSTPDGLQQVGEIEIRIGRFPELDDIFKHMGKLLFEHLRVPVWAAFQRMQYDLPIDHGILPQNR
jgi:hypothetical protein